MGTNKRRCAEEQTEQSARLNCIQGTHLLRSGQIHVDLPGATRPSEEEQESLA